MEQRIVFEDKNVSYKTFLEDLATFLAPKIALLIKNPPKKYYSERESMRVFGSGNVRRWIKEANSNLFPRERERQNTKSATFRSYTEESKTTFKAKSNVQNKKTLSSSREATLAYRPPREVEAFVLCPLPRHRRVQACTPQPRRGHKKARAKLEKRKISPFLHTRHNRERR